ncbi:zinc ribbon domain-containing protein [Haloarcula sp. H-GB4]|uniref:zinc ribbon domain-containing protein n=1 Tax=Haloarcula sp. H-GB4 TaxID=3069755 RepID=UPI0027B4FBEE|nr:zinc ribbon domain-containing protein [Haloarcula sp. H-GB4]MDQ2072457.1 zinc ribbon domain-containing protein [Haloarcula sp. H-GB4]
MAEWRDASDPACPECGEPLEPTAMACPHCDTSLLTDEQTEMLDERLTETLDSVDSGTPTWAVALTGLSLGIAIAPLVLYAVVILVGDLSLPVAVGVLLTGWLGPAAYLSRLRNPSEVLARGLYLVVAGVAVVVVVVGYEVLLSDGPSVVSEQTALVSLGLAIPAALGALIARRAARRADRQARGEPGPLHERFGIDDDEPDN